MFDDEYFVVGCLMLYNGGPNRQLNPLDKQGIMVVRLIDVIDQ